MATYMTLGADQAIFARQLRQLGVNIAWVGSPTTVQTTILKLAGPALFGSYAAADFNADSSPAAKEFATKYEATYKSAPDNFGHGPTTLFMFWRSRSTTLRVLSLRRSARRS